MLPIIMDVIVGMIFPSSFNANYCALCEENFIIYIQLYVTGGNDEYDTDDVENFTSTG